MSSITDYDEHIEETAKKAVADENVLSNLLSDLLPENKNTDLRYSSFRALLYISERHPKVLYDKWDFFVDLMKTNATGPVFNAAYILGELVKVDIADRFKEIFNLYFDLLDHKTLPVAAHVALNAGKIAKAKPKLQSKVVDKLMGIDATHHDPGRRELIKGYAVEAFNEFFDEAKDKDQILTFVYNQLESSSAKTKKLAKDFLKTHKEAV
jgi:hypothetical protein